MDLAQLMLRSFTVEELAGELVRRGYERGCDVGLGKGLERDMLVGPLPELTREELLLLELMRKNGPTMPPPHRRKAAQVLYRRGSLDHHRYDWMYRLTQQGRRELRAAKKSAEIAKGRRS